MKAFLMLKGKRKILLVIIGVILAAVAADYYVGKKQDDFIREKEAKKKRLENLAFFMIFPDILEASVISPERYEAIIKVDNVADEPVYITHPEVMAYVQTGTFWTEVPVQEGDPGKKQQIYKLQTKQYLFRKILTITRDIKYTRYLMPLYMHVRFHISFFVLPESAFNEKEVVERYTDVYVYLKPFFVTDKEILKELNFEEVPQFIPMPPH